LRLLAIFAEYNSAVIFDAFEQLRGAGFTEEWTRLLALAPPQRHVDNSLLQFDMAVAREVSELFSHAAHDFREPEFVLRLLPFAPAEVREHRTFAKCRHVGCWMHDLVLVPGDIDPCLLETDSV
jgi:hypothetical protein